MLDILKPFWDNYVHRHLNDQNIIVNGDNIYITDLSYATNIMGQSAEKEEEKENSAEYGIADSDTEQRDEIGPFEDVLDIYNIIYSIAENTIYQIS